MQEGETPPDAAQVSGALKMPSVAIVATLDTKSAEADYLKDCICSLGQTCAIVDASIESAGRQLSGADKLEAMSLASERAAVELAELNRRRELRVVAGMGGGTGSQIVAGAFSSAGVDAWRVLITTQVLDTREIAGLDDVTIIPAICDVEGLNRLTKHVLRGAAAAVAGLAGAEFRLSITSGGNLVGMTALGVTSPGVRKAKSTLEAAGLECAVFHANGYGGNTMAGLAAKGGLGGILDYTIHELVSLCLDPETGVSEYRFDAPDGCPRVLLPGGVNFLTKLRGRAFGSGRDEGRQYPHSPHIAHVGLSAEEMAELGRKLAERLSNGGGAATVIIPMGGFSSEDRPGGALENRRGREAFADAVEAASCGATEILRVEDHINDPATAGFAAGVFGELIGANMKGDQR